MQTARVVDLNFHHELFYDARTRASALFIESGLQLHFSEPEERVNIPPHFGWENWRRNLCREIFEQWMLNEAYAQLVADATVDGAGNLEFAVVRSLPTFELATREQAAAGIADATERLHHIGKTMSRTESVVLSDPECVAVKFRVHVCTDDYFAPKFQTHDQLPCGVFSGGGFREERSVWQFGPTPSIHRPDSPLTKYRPRGESKVVKLDRNLAARAQEFTREWTNIQAAQDNYDATVGSAIGRLYERLELVPPDIKILEDPKKFIHEAQQAFKSGKPKKDKIRSLFLTDRARYFEIASASLDIQKIRTIHAATTLPPSTPNNLLLQRLAALLPPSRPEIWQFWNIGEVIRQTTFALWSRSDSESLAPYVFMHEQGLVKFGDSLSMWANLHRLPMATLFLGDSALVAAAPDMLTVDDDLRLHNAQGPALRFHHDESAQYFWHGIPIAKAAIEEPITTDMIENEPNIERRRVYLEILGMDNYMKVAQIEVVHEDECGALLRRRFRTGEPLVMVRVKNSTPEPDGTYKDYFLRVPPEMRTAKEAVAWTFGLEPEEYGPGKET